MFCGIHNITNYSTCCRQFTCTASIEHGISKHISMYKYCIKHIIYTVKRAVLAEHKRCYHCITGSVCQSAAGSKKFDGSAKLRSILHIFRCDLCNSLCIYIVKYHTWVKCHRCKDRYLTSCIQTFDISSRISLRISKFCCKCQGILKLHTFLSHLCQNKVCGSVYNTHNFCHVISCQTLFQWSDDRNTTCYCCFKQKIHFTLMCRIQKLMTMYCDQILVCRDYMLTGF